MIISELFEGVMPIIAQAKAEMEKAEEVERKAKEKYDAVFKDSRFVGKYTEYEIAKAQTNYYEAVKSAKEKKEETQKLILEKLDAWHSTFVQAVEEKYRLNAKDLDDETIKLLHSGIKFKNSEYDLLLDSFISNPTMERVVIDHINDNVNFKDSKLFKNNKTLADLNKKVRKCSLMITGDKEKDMADNMLAFAQKTTGETWRGFARESEKLFCNYMIELQSIEDNITNSSKQTVDE